MVLIKLTQFVVIAIAIISVNFSLATENAGNAVRIIGGSVAQQSQFPYQVSIRRSGVHVCAGVIISKRFILTAARCVVKNFANDQIVSYSPHDFNIRVGSNSLYEQGLLVQVAEVLVHPDYTNMLNDLSLMKLQEPLIFSDYIKPISLAYSSPYTAALVNVSGWGFQRPSGDLSRNLQYLQMEVVNPSNCLAYLFGEDADQSLLCLQSVGGICNGDIGGLAVLNYELVGLASFTVERCGSEYPDGFTNIAYYLQWIGDNSDLK